jgi:hypothetical protein
MLCDLQTYRFFQKPLLIGRGFLINFLLVKSNTKQHSMVRLGRMSTIHKRQYPLFVMGDVHGQINRLTDILHRAGLINISREWIGGTARLWFIGDYFDRGPDGIGVIELIKQWQTQAARTGGQVGALLGNHDTSILAADRYGNIRSSTGTTFFSDWLRNGGNIADLDGLQPHHVEWLTNLPAIAHVDGLLLLHADSLFYTEYGNNAEAVNQSIQSIQANGTAQAFDRLLDDFSQRRAFQGNDGEQNLEMILNHFGGKGLIHGHTPISKMTGQPSNQVTDAFVYHNGKCVNVDGGMYLGGCGFLFQPK